MSNRQYAIMWDCHGLEALELVPEPSETTFALLQDKTPPRPPNLLHWELRARYNSQRHYEIYIFSVEPGIEREDIIAMFKNDPEVAVDTIRRIGYCYYSNRSDQVVIK